MYIAERTTNMKKVVTFVMALLGCMAVAEIVRQEIIFWSWDSTCDKIVKKVYEKLEQKTK